MAVFLDSDCGFRCFPCDEGTNWEGLIIPGIRVEVDLRSVYDLDQDRPFGMMVRTGSTLSILASGQNGRYRSPVVVIDDLPPVGEAAVGFTGWQIIIGEGDGKQVLWSQGSS